MLDAKTEPQMCLEREVNAEPANTADLRLQLNWHIDGDTVVFHLSPELCFRLNVPTSSLQ